jgi:hypothetical protein
MLWLAPQVDLEMWERCGKGFHDRYSWIAACDQGVLNGWVPTPALPASAHPELQPALKAAQDAFANISRTVASTKAWKGWSFA